MDELKPCPFCGGEAAVGTTTYSKYSDFSQKNGVTTLYFVNCINEKLDGCGGNNKGLVGGFVTEQKAMESWNTRTGGDDAG